MKVKGFDLNPLLLMVTTQLLLFSCSDNTSVNPFEKYRYWVFSGKVVDSYTNKPLAGVTIDYLDSVGIACSTSTNAHGVFTINGLPIGQRGFTFKRDTAGIGGYSYSQRDMIITAGSTNPDSMFIPVNIYTVVKLFPLSGKLKGKLFKRYFATSPASAAAAVTVKARLLGVDALSSTPVVFSATSDSTGGFLFTELPITENIRVEVSNAVFQNITYRCTTTVLPSLDTGTTAVLPPLYMEPVDLKNSTLTFIASNIYDFVNLKALTLIPVDSPIVLIANKKIASVTLLLKYSSSVNQFVPVKYLIAGDTIRITPQQRLKTSTTYTLYLTATAESGEIKTVDAYGSGYISFTTIPDKLAILASNVITQDGIGLVQVPVDITPYFVLPTNPKPGTVSVEFSGSYTIKSFVWVNKDTIFADPIINFPANATMYTTINGTDTAGNRIYFYLSGDAAFRTEGDIFYRESNIMDGSGVPLENVGLRDTFWIRFSKPLDTTISSITWSDPYLSVNKTLWGYGPNTNSKTWVKAETLFVLPEERLNLQYGDKIAFRIQVKSSQGTKSTLQTFQCTLEKLNLFVKNSSLIDSSGRIREDVGLMEPITLVLNAPISAIEKVNPYFTFLPPGASPSCFTIKKDTIIYTPQIVMSCNTWYGFTLDIILPNGIRASSLCQTQWKTLEGIKLTAIDNKTPQGKYRMLSVLNDSFRVSFSKPIDTSNQAPIRFKPHLRDKDGKEYKSRATWNSALTTVTVYPTDTLRTADALTDQGYMENSSNTRAIAEVVFDLTTKDGVSMPEAGVVQGKIELHTEPGLCVIQTNLLKNHSPLTEVVPQEIPINDFHPDSAILVTFNRPLDTLAIRNGSEKQFFVVADNNAVYYPCAVSFTPDGKTVHLVPSSILQAGKKYFLRLSQVPGAGIKNAGAVSKHAGSFSGRGPLNVLLEKPFMVQNPDIQNLTVSLLPDSNTFLQPGAKRFGYSAGFSYASIVGASNAATNTTVILRLKEAAWNPNHSDSVSGYQAQMQKIDRTGKASAWYLAAQPLPTAGYSPIKDGVSIVNCVPGNEPFFTVFNTQDLDGEGSFYQNGLSMLNDSARILVRIRPCIGDPQSSAIRVGPWSNTLTIVDNVAPCDSEFVTGAFCDSISCGGVMVASTVLWNNQTGIVISSGYIQITLFPKIWIFGPKRPAYRCIWGNFRTPCRPCRSRLMPPVRVG